MAINMDELERILNNQDIQLIICSWVRISLNLKKINNEFWIKNFVYMLQNYIPNVMNEFLDYNDIVKYETKGADVSDFYQTKLILTSKGECTYDYYYLYTCFSSLQPNDEKDILNQCKGKGKWFVIKQTISDIKSVVLYIDGYEYNGLNLHQNNIKQYGKKISNRKIYIRKPWFKHAKKIVRTLATSKNLKGRG
eukprot:330567_1